MAYTGLTVVMTWPMVLRLSAPFYNIQGDFGLWLWDLWWMKKALVDLGTSPYFTSYLFHPTGTSLVFHNLSPYNGLVGIPLQLLGADVITTYNLLYLSSFVIGGVGMFLLVKELTGNTFAGFFGGAVYAFSPFRTAAYAWTNIWCIQWLPFVLWFTTRLLRKGEWRDSVGLAISLTLATLSDWHQPVMLLLAITVLVLSLGLRRSVPDCVRIFCRVLLGVLLFGLFLSPIGYVILQELRTGDTIHWTASWFNQFELLGMRYPGWNVISYPVLLGWVPLGVAAYGVIRGLDPWMKRFAALGVAFFLLALGERLRVPGFGDTVLPLPFLLWRQIPLLGTMRSSIYFWAMVMVCFAVLAGYGAKTLWERIESSDSRPFPLARPVLGAAVILLTLFEFLQAPLRPVSLKRHPLLDIIRREGDRGAVLDAPIGYTWGSNIVYAGRSMYLQTIHERPMVGGYTQFDGKRRIAFLDQNPALHLFMAEKRPRFSDQPRWEKTLRSFLADHGIAWVILRRGLAREKDPACDEPRPLGWTSPRLAAAVAPAVFNRELRSVWHWRGHCLDWDAHRAQKLEPLLGRIVGPPAWEDDELVAYRVR